MSRATRAHLTAAVLLCTACGDDDIPPPATDAGVDSGAPDAGFTVPPFSGGMVSIATLNLLHGLTCTDGESCRLADRVELFGQHADASCPDVIALQEIWNDSAPLVTERVGEGCAFDYPSVARSETVLGVDDELILSRYPILSATNTFLYNDFRHALHALIDHPLGPVDVYATHLASGSDGARDPCGTDCPAECAAAGATTVRDCQGVQLAALVAETRAPEGVALVVGDFNVRPAEFVYQHFLDEGFLDAWTAAGLPECDPLTGDACTSGRRSEDLSHLEASELNVDERIDFIFVSAPPGRSCDVVAAQTALFAGEPNPFDASCGPAPMPMCWASDHSGVATTVDCP